MTSNRAFILTFWISLLVTAALMAVRIYHGISFAEPLQFITSGDEQGSLFAIWKAVNGLGVYADPTQSPYSMSFYNALFYEAYGLWTRFWMSALSLGDAWLPTVSRFLTLLAVLAGWVVSLVLFRRIAAPGDTAARLIAPFAATILFIGPLMGFWAFTVRPDLWAFVFEICAVLLFVRTYGTNRNLAAVFAAVLFFAAWMFKQAAISGVCGIGLFLLIERQWRALALFCVIYLVLCLGTLAGGSDLYRQSIFFTQIKLEYDLGHGLKVWSNAIVKTLPIYLPLMVVVLALITQSDVRRRFFEDWTNRLFLYGFAASAGVIFVLSLQTASAENYVFTPTLFAAGLMIGGYARMEARSASGRLVTWSWLGAAVVHAALCLLVLTGHFGVLDPTVKSHPKWVDTARCINTHEKPIFVQNTYLSLPWMTESAEPFVLSYTYDRARELGMPHEKGGIGGRIEAGEFKTLALLTDQAETGYDGARLDNYKRQPEQCGDMFVWVRVEP